MHNISTWDNQHFFYQKARKYLLCEIKNSKYKSWTGLVIGIIGLITSLIGIALLIVGIVSAGVGFIGIISVGIGSFLVLAGAVLFIGGGVLRVRSFQNKLGFERRMDIPSDFSSYEKGIGDILEKLLESIKRINRLAQTAVNFYRDGLQQLRNYIQIIWDPLEKMQQSMASYFFEGTVRDELLRDNATHQMERIINGCCCLNEGLDLIRKIIDAQSNTQNLCLNLGFSPDEFHIIEQRFQSLLNKVISLSTPSIETADSYEKFLINQPRLEMELMNLVAPFKNLKRLEPGVVKNLIARINEAIEDLEEVVSELEQYNLDEESITFFNRVTCFDRDLMFLIERADEDLHCAGNPKKIPGVIQINGMEDLNSEFQEIVALISQSPRGFTEMKSAALEIDMKTLRLHGLMTRSYLEIFDIARTSHWDSLELNLQKWIDKQSQNVTNNSPYANRLLPLFSKIFLIFLQLKESGNQEEAAHFKRQLVREARNLVNTKEDGGKPLSLPMESSVEEIQQTITDYLKSTFVLLPGVINEQREIANEIAGIQAAFAALPLGEDRLKNADLKKQCLNLRYTDIKKEEADLMEQTRHLIQKRVDCSDKERELKDRARLFLEKTTSFITKVAPYLKKKLYLEANLGKKISQELFEEHMKRLYLEVQSAGLSPTELKLFSTVKSSHTDYLIKWFKTAQSYVEKYVEYSDKMERDLKTYLILIRLDQNQRDLFSNFQDRIAAAESLVTEGRGISVAVDNLVAETPHPLPGIIRRLQESLESYQIRFKSLS